MILRNQSSFLLKGAHGQTFTTVSYVQHITLLHMDKHISFDTNRNKTKNDSDGVNDNGSGDE